MVRRLALVAALAAGCSSSPRSDVYITVDRDAVADVHGHLIEEDGHVAVLSIDARELDALSERMHEQHHRCGGFMVHDSLADAEAAMHPLATRPGPGYSIDHPAQVEAALAGLDRQRIVTTIRELSSMKNRYYQSDTGAAASSWLRDRWRSFSTRSDVTIELVDHGYAQKSVVMTIPGTTKASEVVVIGGHLDSISLGGKQGTAPGADDDASGVATMTEIARVLLADDIRPERTIKFIAYAAEEVGLRGSLSIARDFQKRGVNVVGALQLDMTNYQGSDRDIWLMDDYTDAAQNAFIGTLIDTYVGATWGYDSCGYACSDHASWTRIGVPASMPFESRSADRNKKIHTGRDTLETSDANAAHALKFARLGAAYAIELAKGDLGGAATISSAPASGSSHIGLIAFVAFLALMLGARALSAARRSP